MRNALDILREICVEYGLNRDQISGRCQKASFADARRAFCHRARAEGYSLTKIGGFINRHHSTVLEHLRFDIVPPAARVYKGRAKFKADYTEEEIERMTRRVLGRAWD